MASAKVLEKLKKHPGYKGQDTNEDVLIQTARKLSDPEEIKLEFSYLLDSISKIVLRTSEIDQDLTSLETESRIKKHEDNLACAMKIPVRLILRKLRHHRPPLANRLSQLLRCEYGPFHSRLQIGEINIEWGNESLVIPSMEPIFPGVFEAQVENQSEWCHTTKLLTKALGDAEVRRDYVEKFNIMFTSMSEKLQLIDRLVDVIVTYNCEKNYNIFTCNCQHFTRDALSALGYKDSIRFTGKLSDYLEQLKSGKLTVPEEYNTHENLDKYVEENLDRLTIPDMEYLLCQYFKYHLPSMELMGNGDLDDWKCAIETCQSEELDFRVRDKSSLQSFFNNRDSDLDLFKQSLPEELQKVTLAEQEKIMKTIKGGYREKVLNKLRHYQNSSLLKDEDIIDKLTEREKFRDNFCTDIIEGMSEALVVEASEEFQKKDMCLIGSTEARDNAAMKMKVFCNFPVRLLLYCSKRGSSTLTTALQVGKFCFEWNKTSLIIPQAVIDVVSKQPVLKVGVSQERAWSSYVEELEPRISRALEQLDYSELIQLIYQLAQKKDELLSTFIDVVMRYNRESSYHTWKCNVQHFFNDAQQALGISHSPGKASKTYQEHLKKVRQTWHKKTNEKLKFESHDELDVFVDNLIDLNQEDSEYFIAQYFAIHVSVWEKEEPHEIWSCDRPNCKLRRLEESVKLS